MKLQGLSLTITNSARHAREPGPTGDASTVLGMADDPEITPGTTTPPGGGTAPAATTPETEPSLTPSIKARMDELTAEKWSKHREAAAAEARARVAEQALAEANARLAAMGTGQPVAPGVAPAVSPPRTTGRETAAEI